MACLAGGLPFGKNRTEPARIDELPASLLAHLKPIISQPALVDRFVRISRPLQRLEDCAIQREPFVVGVAGVVVVNAHGARRGKTEERRKNKERKQQKTGWFHARNCTTASFSKLVVSPRRWRRGRRDGGATGPA